MPGKFTVKESEQKINELEKEVLKLKLSEQALRENEEKLRALLDTTSDWVWEIDINGAYTYVSPKVRDILGYNVDEVIGVKFFDFVLEEETEAHKSFFEDMCTLAQPFSGHKSTQRRKNGQRVIIEVNGSPVFDKEGNLSGWCGFDKDITEKVLAEEALMESKERYRNLFENTQAGVFRATMDGSNFFDVNKKFAEIFGYSIEEILAKPTEFRLTDSKYMAEMFRHLRDRGSVENYEMETSTKHGEKITCIASIKLFRKQEYVEGTIVDITERKKAEVALREREAELDLKNESLEEMNAALRVLLKKREEDKTELEEKVLLNIQRLLIPFLDKLNTSKLDEKQTSYVSILKSNLNDIISPFSRKLSSNHLKLSPAEIQISNLVKQGKATKEIAGLLNLSITTIETHRRNIRKKIGLKNRNQNLRIHLLDLQE